MLEVTATLADYEAPDAILIGRFLRAISCLARVEDPFPSAGTAQHSIPRADRARGDPRVL